MSRGCGHGARDGLGLGNADLRVDPGLGDVVAWRPDLGPAILPWPGGLAPDWASVPDPDDHKIMWEHGGVAPRRDLPREHRKPHEAHGHDPPAPASWALRLLGAASLPTKPRPATMPSM